jgi:hypothetical protein
MLYSVLAKRTQFDAQPRRISNDRYGAEFFDYLGARLGRTRRAKPRDSRQPNPNLNRPAREFAPVTKEPRNPLKNLDSDERIQGNPRKSNPQNRGSLQ